MTENGVVRQVWFCWCSWFLWWFILLWLCIGHASRLISPILARFTQCGSLLLVSYGCFDHIILTWHYHFLSGQEHSFRRQIRRMAAPEWNRTRRSDVTFRLDVMSWMSWWGTRPCPHILILHQHIIWCEVLTSIQAVTWIPSPWILDMLELFLIYILQYVRP